MKPEKTEENPVITIGAPGLDTGRIVEEIRSTVERKIAEGVYADARIARAEKANIAHLRQEEQFISFYLQCLRDAVFVDISDFEIRERRKYLAPLLVGFKKVLWKLLKFYTYRLWSQQNQINGLMVTAVEGLEEQYSERLKTLEARVRELEEKVMKNAAC